MFEDVRLIENRNDVPLKVWLEPWCFDFQVPPGQALRVIGRSTREGHLEVAEYEDCVGIYGWEGATVQVFLGDTLLEELETILGDPLPGGGSLRSFIEQAFGGPGKTGASCEHSEHLSINRAIMVVLLIAILLGLLVALGQ